MTTSNALSVARWIERSEVNGPGERFVLWVQGCTLHCAGCWNRDTWDLRPTSGSLVDVLSAIDQTPELEGVTLTGGEPFQQAEALVSLARECSTRGLTIMAFTGYEMDELVSGPQRELLSMLDIVITGRYIAKERTLDLPWRGSRNQQVHFMSSRYSVKDMPASRQSEVHLASDGTLVVTGFPEVGIFAG